MQRYSSLPPNKKASNKKVYFSLYAFSSNEEIPPENYGVPQEIINDFNEVAQHQRGEPEHAMLDVQMAQISQLYGYLLEHVGDLTHRMSENIHYIKGGYENVKEKVDRALKYLKQGESDFLGMSMMDFKTNVLHQIKSNVKFHKEEGEDWYSYEEALEKLHKLGQRYAQAHANIPTFNEAQEKAKNAAIALGNFRFDEAIKNLEYLKSIIDKGPEEWQKAALQHPNWSRDSAREQETSQKGNLDEAVEELYRELQD